MPTCRSCSTVIDWAVLPNGTPMPLDRASAGDPSGNVAVRRSPGGVGLEARVLKDGEEPDRGEIRAISHFATCPNAAQHRKRDQS